MLRTAPLLHRLNIMDTFDPEYSSVLKEIFGDNLGEESFIAAPISGACISTVKLGNPSI